MNTIQRLPISCAIAAVLVLGVLHESPAQVVAVCPEQEVRLTAPDAAIGARLGSSVAIDRDTIVVGAPEDDEDGPFSGSVYVFVRSGACWVQEAKLTGSGAPLAFGESVAISKDTIVVGAPFDGSDGDASGAAYVFVRTGGGWTELAKLRPSDAEPNKQFGSSVAIDGATLVVGAFLDSEVARASGAAYVFGRKGDEWVERSKLIASDAAEFAFFGDAVSISGIRILVGARGAEATYVFVRRGQSWFEQAKLTASDGAGRFAEFGRAVAISNRTAVVGAPRDDGADQRAGAAYVFAGLGSSWVERAKLTASDAAVQDELGTAVAVSGNIIVVGAPFAGELNEGAVYRFDRRGLAWLEQARLVPSIEMAAAFFGASLDLTKDTLVVGAPSFVHFTGTCCSGAAHVLPLDPKKPLE